MVILYDPRQAKLDPEHAGTWIKISKGVKAPDVAVSHARLARFEDGPVRTKGSYTVGNTIRDLYESDNPKDDVSKNWAPHVINDPSSQGEKHDRYYLMGKPIREIAEEALDEGALEI